VTVYVDALMNHGWRLRGRTVANCHLFTDSANLEELHRFAERIGMKQTWFQSRSSVPHYDLTPKRRAAAVAAGAVEVDRRQAVTIWRATRQPSGRRCQCMQRAA
jgi:hypothetical protein